MQATISNKERIISLDIIRGISLFGILMINVPAFIMLVEGGMSPDYSGVNGVIYTLITIFVEKKFFSMFSFLFGVGFYIFASRAEARGDRPLLRFSRRLMVLFLLGIIHIFIFWGSILSMYAIIGFALIPFYRVKPKKTLMFVGGLTAIYSTMKILMLFYSSAEAVPPFISFIGNDTVLIYIMFLLGFLAAKTNVIQRVSDNKTLIKLIQVITFLLFIGFSIWIWTISPDLTVDGNMYYSNQVIGLGAIPMTLFYLSTLFLLTENKVVQKMMQPVALVGKMAFTNYIAQSIIGLQIISLIGLEVVSPNQTVIIAVIIYTIQIIFSVVWFKFFKMGPLEKVWRVLTYGKQLKAR